MIADRAKAKAENMAEAATGDPQSNSPARQLLAALSRASQEMESSVNETYEYVSRLNANLEKVVGAELEEIGEQVELLVRNQMDGISAEKDAILSQLTELRKEELKVLQSTGKSLRLALLEKVEELVAAFQKGCDTELQTLKAELDKSENTVGGNIKNRLEWAQNNLPSQVDELRKGFDAERKRTSEYSATIEQRFEKESAASLDELKEHSTELRSRLQAEGEKYHAGLEKLGQELKESQIGKFKTKCAELEAVEEQVSRRVNDRTVEDVTFLAELPEKFSQSCRQMAEVQVAMHATVIKNLSLQYRTEILSSVQEADDHLQIVRADLHSLLRQYQNHYSEQFESILSKFEKNANELAAAQDNGDGAPQNNETTLKSVNEYFAGIRKNTQEKIRSLLSEIEVSMESAYEEFRVNLENARKSACDKVELSFKVNQDELNKLQQANEEQLDELNKKLVELEQSVAEAKELIRALDQASLDF